MKHRNVMHILAVISLTSVMFGCGDDASNDNDGNGFQLPPLEESKTETINEGMNAFAFNLMRTIYVGEEESNTNLFISPLSASLALSMLNNGAVGTTSDEIRSTLGFSGLTTDEINAYFAETVRELAAADADVTFEDANAMWFDSKTPILDSFKDVNAAYYGAVAENADFSNPVSVAAQINEWCNVKTHGMIPELIRESQINTATVVMLANALYFQGKWTNGNAFDSANTVSEVFTNADESETTWPLMNVTAALRYYKTDNLQAVSLPYGNGSYRMDVFLPDDMTAFISDMSADYLNELQYAWEVSLKLPKFMLEYAREDMQFDLMKLGCIVPFSETEADFSKMTSTEVLVSKVIQKAKITVNEEGSEAAAATVIGMDSASLPMMAEPAPIEVMNVNRPFAFTIREQTSGVILFMGVVRNLTEDNQ
jgi:serpin B